MFFLINCRDDMLPGKKTLARRFIDCFTKKGCPQCAVFGTIFHTLEAQGTISESNVFVFPFLKNLLYLDRANIVADLAHGAFLAVFFEFYEADFLVPGK